MFFWSVGSHASVKRDETWGVGSSAPTREDEDKEDPEAEEWDTKFQEVVTSFGAWAAPPP